MKRGVIFKSPINGALIVPPISHPGVNAWARENRTMKLGHHPTSTILARDPHLQPAILKRHSLHARRLAPSELVHARVLAVVHEVFDRTSAGCRTGIATERAAECG